MTIIGEAFIAVKPDAKGFAASADKEVTGALGGLAKKAAGILAGGLAVSKGFSFLGDSVGEARESNKVAAQTEAAIRSTGAAAKVTSGQVSDLANAISRKTGIDDEAIQKAENLLLTFTGVRNEVGKGNDIFNQATNVLADMGAALGTDASSSAIQLGKALNDPVAGITALTRVGVTFSAQQKEQIKGFVDAGKTAEAQKIILAELNKEFGGSAAAQATSADRLKVTIGNIKEQIGGVLVPLIDRASSFLADRLPGALAATGRAFDRIKAAVAPVIAGIRLFVNALRTGFTEDEGTPIENLALLIRERLLPILTRVASFVKDNLKPILIGLAGVFLAFTAPITGTVAALTLLYLKSKTVRDGIDAVVDALSAFVGFVRTKVVPTVAPVVAQIVKSFSDLARGVSERLDSIQEAVGHLLTVLKVAVAVALAPIVLLWRQFGDDILKVVTVVFRQLRDGIEVAIRVIRDVIDAVLAIINGDWGKAWNAIKDIPLAVLGFLRDTIGRVVQLVGIALGAAVDVVRSVWSVAWDKFTAAPGALLDFVKGIPAKLGGLVGDVAGGAAKLGQAIFDGIVGGIASLPEAIARLARAAFNGLVGIVETTLNAIITAINLPVTLINKLPGPDLPTIPNVHLPRIAEPAVPPTQGAGGIGGPGRVGHLAAGGIVTRRPGGLAAIIGEGARDEAVIPLPPGLLPALEKLAAGGLSRGPLVGQIVAPATVDDPVGWAYRAAQELEAVAYRNRWSE